MASYSGLSIIRMFSFDGFDDQVGLSANRVTTRKLPPAAAAGEWEIEKPTVEQIKKQNPSRGRTRSTLIDKATRVSVNTEAEHQVSLQSIWALSCRKGIHYKFRTLARQVVTLYGTSD